MNIKRIGIDLAKQVFQLHGVDGQEKVVLRKQLRRAQMLDYFKKLPPCLIGMEACGGAHYWASRWVNSFIVNPTLQCIKCWVGKNATQPTQLRYFAGLHPSWFGR